MWKLYIHLLHTMMASMLYTVFFIHGRFGQGPMWFHHKTVGLCTYSLYLSVLWIPPTHGHCDGGSMCALICKFLSGAVGNWYPWSKNCTTGVVTLMTFWWFHKARWRNWTRSWWHWTSLNIKLTHKCGRINMDFWAISCGWWPFYIFWPFLGNPRWPTFYYTVDHNILNVWFRASELDNS